MRKLLLVSLLLFAGCASAPKQVNNACAIFDEKDGWFNSWHKAAKDSSREFGVPIPVLLATINTESGFQPYARPPRKKFLWIFPGARASSAYGYSQALDGTWDQYRSATGRSGASRTDFADAIHFIGWYHATSNRKNGISLSDPYNLYMAYYSGHSGYNRGVWRNNSTARNGAQRTLNMSRRYEAQLQRCGRL